MDPNEIEACPIERKVAFLSRPGTYGQQGRVEVVETHLSWVFLTKTRAYKLKKPVHLQQDSLDLRRISQREVNCAEELRLNRRLSPDVYLGRFPLTLDDWGILALDGVGEVVDWLVAMRRLPAKHMLEQAIANGRVDEDALRDVVRTLVHFYQQVAEPAGLSPAAYRALLAKGLEEDRRALAKRGYGLSVAAIEELAAQQRRLLHGRPELFDERVAAGRVVEGHGDLRPEHVCLEPLAVIDCLEFSRELRTVDAADELAFLALECERLEAGQLGALVLDEYRAASGDAPPPELLAFYRRYRAMRRAKIAAWHLDDAEVSAPERWRERARRYLALAAEQVSPRGAG